MNKIWEIYEELRELVYVTDFDTYEMIYMNRFGRERFGINSVEELRGIHCHELIKNCSSPCSICSSDKLAEGKFYEWKYYNAILDKTFLIKDTLIEDGGRRYKMQLTIDISETEDQKKTIDEFTSNEAMVNDIIRLSLSQPTPEQGIKILLQHLGESLESDRVYIFEEMPDHTVSNTYEWCARDVEPQIDFLQNVPFEVVELWYDSFNKNENVIVKGLDSIRDTHPQIYETLLPQQVDSLVVSPIISNDNIIGFYGVDNPPKEFLNHISVMFMVLGYFISSLLKRRDLLKHLQKMSYTDGLTGAMNRNAMNEFIANADRNASIGLVYCDVMGLKQLNDSKGHLFGDELLINSYNCICDCFPKECVFRIGGDEFLVMYSGITEEEHRKKIEALRLNINAYDVRFAIGTVWQEHCNGMITDLLKLADTRMYKDKADYYSQNPNNRRRR